MDLVSLRRAFALEKVLRLWGGLASAAPSKIVVRMLDSTNLDASIELKATDPEFATVLTAFKAIAARRSSAAQTELTALGIT